MKNVNKTILTIGLLLIVVGLAVASIIVIPRLTSTTDRVAPTAPESKPAAFTTATESATRELIIPKMSNACTWTKAKQDGYASGYSTSTVTFGDCTILGGKIESVPPIPDGWVYDDVLYILVDGKIFSGGDESLQNAGQALGDVWDWEGKVEGTRQRSRYNTQVCYGSGGCLAPNTRRSTLGDTTGAISMDLSAAVSNLLDPNLDQHTITAIVTGDNNEQTDCRIRNDLKVTLQLSCTTTTPECRDGLDNDGDGKIDCTAGAEDPGCFPDGRGGGGTCNPEDDSEIDSTTECSDGVDNDGDSKIDCTAGAEDPGCFPDGHGGGGACMPSDDSELDVTVPECRDGIDNDEDGKIDCTGTPDPGCFPDGHGGGGACNGDDDDEEDATIRWGNVCSADITLTEPTPTPTGVPTPTPTRSAGPTATPTPTGVPTPTATPTRAALPDTAALPTATPTPAQELPEAGLSLPTIGALGGGMVMILLGILLAL